MLEKVCDVQINYYRMFYNNLVADMVSDSRLTKEELFLRARPIDDIFGKRMLENNMPLAQFMLRIITGEKDLEITEGHAQHVSSNVDNHKVIIRDSYYRDREGNIYCTGLYRVFVVIISLSFVLISCFITSCKDFSAFLAITI